jgi:hypothetical protein
MLTSTNRFTALQSGEIDLLVRSATWALGRESGLSLLFAGANFYVGTGFMVHTASGVSSADQLDGATICMLPGTTTELAVPHPLQAVDMAQHHLPCRHASHLPRSGRSGSSRSAPRPSPRSMSAARNCLSPGELDAEGLVYLTRLSLRCRSWCSADRRTDVYATTVATNVMDRPAWRKRR